MEKGTSQTNSPTIQNTKQSAIEKYWKAAAFIGLVVLGAGLVVTLILSQSGKKEKQAQDQLYALENLYFKHLEAGTTNPMQAPDKAPPAPVDTEKLKADLKTFATAHKGFVASQMASMYLSDLLLKENKSSEALEILKAAKSTEPHLTSLLLINKIGQIQAQLNLCNEAVSTWDDLLKIKSAQFLKDEIKINQALCFIEQKDWAKAEKILTNIKNENLQLETLSKDSKKLAEASPATQTAVRNATQTNREVEKILRLIQFRQNNEMTKSGT